MKKTTALFTLIILFVILVIALFSGGLRGGDAFQESTSEAMDIHFGSPVNMDSLSEVHECKDDICIEVFWNNDLNNIHCATFEKRNNKYAYLYGYDFSQEEITDKSGLNAYEVDNKSDVVYGIMPSDKKGVIINQNILSESFSFEANGTEYKCWYASVDGGYSAVEDVSYQL